MSLAQEGSETSPCPCSGNPSPGQVALAAMSGVGCGVQTRDIINVREDTACLAQEGQECRLLESFTVLHHDARLICKEVALGCAHEQQLTKHPEQSLGVCTSSEMFYMIYQFRLFPRSCLSGALTALTRGHRHDPF